jgi:ribonucleotide reductase alpha subunit
MMLGLHYGTAAAREQASTIVKAICHTAYRSSIALAHEKCAFPSYDQVYATVIYWRSHRPVPSAFWPTT